MKYLNLFSDDQFSCAIDDIVFKNEAQCIEMFRK